MLAEGLRVEQIWIVHSEKGHNFEEEINNFLDKNQDIEIVHRDIVYYGHTNYPCLIIWYRKIDPNWRQRRGPEA
ncbi:hypothetical protein KJ885_04260 [Patescibacteria group bacterium]|nr:hypothetical protein [Patescibacteria group bacterium]